MGYDAVVAATQAWADWMGVSYYDSVRFPGADIWWFDRPGWAGSAGAANLLLLVSLAGDEP